MKKPGYLLLAVVFAGSMFASGSGGGGGATGGGATGGGGGTSTGTCSYVSSFSVSSSYSPYGSSLTDVKASYTLKACTPTFNPSTKITVTDVATGIVAWSYSFGGLKVTTPPYGNLPIETTYRVDMEVTDYSTGAVVDTRTATTTTPKAKALTTP